MVVSVKSLKRWEIGGGRGLRWGLECSSDDWCRFIIIKNKKIYESKRRSKEIVLIESATQVVGVGRTNLIGCFLNHINQIPLFDFKFGLIGSRKYCSTLETQTSISRSGDPQSSTLAPGENPIPHQSLIRSNPEH